MRALLALSVGLLLLSSCGRVFCVGPLGPIDECYATPQSSSGSSSSTTAFHIAVTPTQYQGVNSPAGTQLTLTVANGAGGTYSWVLSAVTAASTAPTFTNSAGSSTTPITGSTTYFTSAANTTGAYQITVTDGANGTTATTFIAFP